MTFNDFVTASGKYPERLKSPELTDSVKKEIQITFDTVKAFFEELGLDINNYSVSSGFRPSGVNAATPGAAKKSAHMVGTAVDILDDKNQTLGKLIRKIQNNQGKKGILGRHKLMMEKLEATIGKFTNWVHLDRVVRSERPSMEFQP